MERFSQPSLRHTRPMSQVCCEIRPCHKSQVAHGSRGRVSKRGILGKWEHSVFDCFSALTAGCFVYSVSFDASAAQTASVSQPVGNTTGARPTSTAIQINGPIDVIVTIWARASRKRPQSRRGMQPPAQHLLNHSSSLRYPIVCQGEPRLHAHGRTVRHHRAGSTRTSGRPSSKRAQRAALQIRGRR
jgi:hypothetical protein